MLGLRLGIFLRRCFLEARLELLGQFAHLLFGEHFSDFDSGLGEHFFGFGEDFFLLLVGLHRRECNLSDFLGLLPILARLLAGFCPILEHLRGQVHGLPLGHDLLNCLGEILFDLVGGFLAQSGWFELLEKLVDHRGFRIATSSLFGRVLGGEIRTEKSDHRRANQKVLEHETLPPKNLITKTQNVDCDSPDGLRRSAFIFQ